MEILSQNNILSLKQEASSGKSKCEYVLDSEQKKSTWALEMQHLYQDEDPFITQIY
jgi:hypothetical protein